MKARYKRDLYGAAQYATDRASKGAQVRVQGKIRAVGLGRLSGAVGQTSSLRKRQKPRQPYGVIYARGGDESRAGQALEAYSTGVTIRARNGSWLAFATAAVPRTLARKMEGRLAGKRTSPLSYRLGGMQTSIGTLVFKPIRPGLAYLVVRNVTLHPKTHRAKRAGPRAPRTRIPAKEVIAFVLIRVTRRAKRFDKDREVRPEAARVPDYVFEYLEAAKRSPIVG